MNIFGSDFLKHRSSVDVEWRQRVLAAERELASLLREDAQQQLEFGFARPSLSMLHLATSPFTRIWALAIAFGLLSVGPLLLYSDRYPWSVIAVVIVGSICTLTIDFVMTERIRRASTLYTEAVSIGAAPTLSPIDLSNRQKIDISTYYEREFWARRFGITEDELREAVLTVGPDTATLTGYIAYTKTKAKSPPTPDPSA